MSTRAQLSETLNRLLPGESKKRIREGILAAAGYSGTRTDQLRQSIDQANRVKTGRLVAGEVNFTSTTSADISGYAWVSNFAVLQQAALETITVLAPDPDVARPDSFVGMPDGSIGYRAGILDAFGNAKAATLANDEVLLELISRNPNETNDFTPIDPAVPNTAHNSLPSIQGGIPAIGVAPAEHFHLTKQELLKLQRVTANTSANAVLTYGTVVFSSPTSVTLEVWEWLINGVELADPIEILATTGTPATYPRPELFVALADGSIDYRPAVTDEFGNAVLPELDEVNEVVLAVVIRDPDGNNSVLNPNEYFESAFPEQLFQTAVQANTTGLYAKVWGAAILPNNTYHIQLSYGAPSSEADWDVNASARSGILNLTFFCLAGDPITGIHFETIDGKSEAGDWALIRTGDQVALYHKSSEYWQRAYYRVILVAGAATRYQIFNRQIYAALPTNDQNFDSVPLGGGGGADPNAVHYNAADSKSAPEQAQARANIDAQQTIASNIIDGLVAGASPATGNPFVTVSALTAYAYINHGPNDGKAYVSKSNAWVQLSPYDLKQEGATDGQALLWSAANSRYQPGTVAGGGSPAGSHKEIQYNNSGVFGASPNFIWDSVTPGLGINSSPLPGYGLTVGGAGSNAALIGVYRNASNVNFGSSFRFLMKNSVGTIVEYGSFGGSIGVNTAGNHSGFVQILTANSGALETQITVNSIGMAISKSFNPLVALDVVDSNPGSLRIIRIWNKDNLSSGSGAEVRIVPGDNAMGILRFSDNANARSSIYSSTLDDLIFKTSSAEITRLTISSAGLFTFAEACNLALGTITGTKFGVSTAQKLSFWNATPIIQPTTAITPATRVGGGGAAVTDTDTFDGYTLAKVVKALRNTGLLA